MAVSAADISFSKGKVLVLDKFETLIAVERELRVARHQGHALSDGVRDDDMVARVVDNVPCTFAHAFDVGEQVDDDTGVEHQSHGRMIFCPSL